MATTSSTNTSSTAAATTTSKVVKKSKSGAGQAAAYARAKRKGTVNPNFKAGTAAAEGTTKAAQAARKPGFAPGARPGVVTVSGQNVFKNGKLVQSSNDAEAAQKYAAEITAPQGSKGQILNVMGDQAGETYRQLRRVDPGVQTGRANVAGIVASQASKGLASTVETMPDGTERVTSGTGMKTVEKYQKRQQDAAGEAERPIKPPVGTAAYRNKPLLDRDAAAEATKRAELVKKFGVTDENQLSAVQRRLLNESINTEVYGRAYPMFKDQAKPSVAEQSLTPAEEATPVAESDIESTVEETPRQITTIVTSDEADEYTESQLSDIGSFLADSSAVAEESLNDLISTDQEVLDAQEAGDDMAAFLQEKTEFYEQQYNDLRSEIQRIYDEKETDYAGQADQAMGSAVSALAAMGIYGTSSAAVQYVDDVGRDNAAKLLALAAEESAALQSAYNSFLEADFGIAEKMLTNAQQTQQTIRQIKAEQLDRRIKVQQLKAVEQENGARTVEAAIKAGISPDDVPDDYLRYLDAKSGYAPGTTKGLLNLGMKERQKLDEQAEIEQATSLVGLLKTLPFGEEVVINGTAYKSLNQGDVQTGVETNPLTGEMWGYTFNSSTGKTDSRLIGNFGNIAYEDFTDPTTGVVVRNFANGQNVVVYDPSQFNGGLSTGGLIDSFPDGSAGGQCGRFINQLMGTRVGDTDESKMAITDSSITADTAGVGDIFVQDRSKIGKWTGHIGVINGKFVKNGEIYFKVSESNWNGDEKVTHTREVPASKMSGFARGNFVDPKNNFKSPDSPYGLDEEAIKSYVTALKGGQIGLSSIPEEMRTEVAKQAFLSSESAEQIIQKALGGDVAKVYSIATTIVPEIEELKSAFRTDYKGSLTGILSNTDPRLSKLVDNVADKIGRLRSGGAVNTDEAARFKRQIASIFDVAFGNPEDAISALDGLLEEANTVARGINPSYSGGYASDYGGLDDESYNNLSNLWGSFGFFE